jgi:hypothetical protein
LLRQKTLKRDGVTIEEFFPRFIKKTLTLVISFKRQFRAFKKTTNNATGKLVTSGIVWKRHVDRLFFCSVFLLKRAWTRDRFLKNLTKMDRFRPKEGTRQVLNFSEAPLIIYQKVEILCSKRKTYEDSLCLFAFYCDRS